MKTIATPFRSEIRKNAGVIAGMILRTVTRGRFATAALVRYERACRQEWRDHCFVMQAELDAERMRGWGFRFLDGKRIDL